MDPVYADTVRLLLTVAPDVFANDIFALKGGTAINLFIQEMPRLSVDLDVVYVPHSTPRETALQAITEELAVITRRLAKHGLRSRNITPKGTGDPKLIVENDHTQVKIEVNNVFRGTVLPPERRSLCAKTANQFSMALMLPCLATDELYGSKLVAALDRQHPRDLFDVWHLYQSGGLSAGMMECFVTYLAGHNRPMHELLFCRDKNIENEYHNSFVGLTREAPVALEVLLDTRAQLRADIATRLTDPQKQFLIGLANAQPDWRLLQCPHAASLPALRWKLSNLQTFRRSRPEAFQQQANLLAAKLYE